MTSRCFWQNYFRLAKMKTANEKRLFEDLVAPSGVRINGDRPCDIQVLRSEFYRRVITGGSRALGESYMDGWWRCGALDQFFNRVLRTRLDKRVKKTCACWARSSGLSCSIPRGDPGRIVSGGGTMISATVCSPLCSMSG